MNSGITLVALCHCQRASKVILPFIIFAVFDVSFRRYKLQINYSFFYIYICCFVTAACVYNIDCRYTITFEQARALRLGLVLIFGRDVSSSLAQSQEHVYCLMMTSRQELSKEYSRKWVSNAENFTMSLMSHQQTITLQKIRQDTWQSDSFGL